MSPIPASVRIARPTDRLEPLVRQYEQALGLQRLGGFDDHDGFDGVMLGHPGQPWHLEFTRERGAAAGGGPSPEHLLVLYLGDEPAHRAAVERARAAGMREVAAHNPYWTRTGVTFEDLDGYRVVLAPGTWPSTAGDPVAAAAR